MLQHYHKSADKLPSNVPAVTRTRKTARKYNKGGNPITLSLINNSRINCTSLYVNVVISDLVFLTFLFTVDVRNELPLCLFISHPQICIYSDCAARFILQQSDGATQPTQCNRVWLVFSSDCLECGPLEYQSFHNCTYECRYKLNANHSGGLFTFC